MQKAVFKMPVNKESKHAYQWQAQAEEVTQYYGESLYWLFHKFHPDEIMAQYRWQKESGLKDSKKLVGKLMWLKKISHI